ncbi:hypothetical protein OUZ56_027068 [Daphnia magna]|uniref:Transposase n=1 Tax=Daphnia magna TaxID=35525 RepID=A0ABQ9ZPD7_9CRUS|nr:hypothetical protein OUZ56_027068 [Daphnia magna]
MPKEKRANRLSFTEIQVKILSRFFVQKVGLKISGLINQTSFECAVPILNPTVCTNRQWKKSAHCADLWNF